MKDGERIMASLLAIPYTKYMSAYICDDKVFSNIFSGLKMYQKHMVFSDKELEYLLRDWKKKNIQAVCERYPNIKNTDDLPGTIGQQVEMNLTFSPNVSKFQFLKSLECLGYQMSEGSVVNSEELKQVISFQQKIRCDIIDGLKEYENATW